jgi:dTDP-4-dehydrorhamnose reductase
MKILLTGRDGQVGFELRRSLAAIGEVFPVGSAECDFRDPSAVRRLVRSCGPDLIVNPAAYTAVDKAESDRAVAYAINADAPAALAEEAERSGAVMIHFSTDYVFDGAKAGSYTEDDAPDPQSVYGATKLAGERAVSAACRRSLVLRTSWVVGAHGNNFAKTMLRLASERDALGVVADQYGAPTSAALLADWTAHLAYRALRGPEGFPYGLYHAVASGVTTWHAYACHVIERARAAGVPVRVPPGGIKAIATADYPVAAKRPANSRLDNARFQATFGLNAPLWKDGVDQVLDQILPMKAKK